MDSRHFPPPFSISKPTVDANWLTVITRTKLAFNQRTESNFNAGAMVRTTHGAFRLHCNWPFTEQNAISRRLGIVMLNTPREYISQDFAFFFLLSQKLFPHLRSRREYRSARSRDRVIPICLNMQKITTLDILRLLQDISGC